jgi:hypothetical protein
MGATRRPGPLPRAAGWLAAALHLHRHRADPDLSAVVAFPSCRCGALLWPAARDTSEQVPWHDPGPSVSRPDRPAG